MNCTRATVLDIGETFRAAREKRNITCSQAATATRMKAQHIEALERNDFSYMAAPAYARGFIKIYAEYLALDPEPLLNAYTERFAPRERPPLVVDETRRFPGAGIGWKQLARLGQEIRNRMAGRGKVLTLAAGIAAVASLAAWMLLRGTPATLGSASTSPQEMPAVPAQEPLPLLREPPDPYLDGAPRVLEGTPPSRPLP